MTNNDDLSIEEIRNVVRSMQSKIEDYYLQSSPEYNMAEFEALEEACFTSLACVRALNRIVD